MSRTVASVLMYLTSGLRRQASPSALALNSMAATLASLRSELWCSGLSMPLVPQYMRLLAPTPRGEKPTMS